MIVLLFIQDKKLFFLPIVIWEKIKPPISGFHQP